MSIRIDGTNTTANPGITGSDTDTGLQFGTNEVKVVTDGSTRATVDSSGNVGIGTSSPSELLHTVKGSGTSRVRFEASASHSFARLVAGSTSFNSGVEFFSGTTNTANITAEGDGELVVEANGSERMRILSDGTIKLASGCPGIDFSQLQTNASGMTTETLDSYEEGTWTPTVTVEGQSAATTDKQNGRYVKIGSMVTVWAYVQLNGTPTGRGVNNAWQHGGLPFPKRNDEGGFDIGGPIMFWTIDDTSALNGTPPYMLVARLFNNSSGGRIRGHDSSSSQAGQNLSLLLKDNTEYAYSFTYETTA
jgi:hypothetical protein